MYRICITCLTIVCAAATAGGAERGFYTEAKMNALTTNLEQHEWARQQRDEITAAADQWARHDDERLRTLVMSPQLPRAVVANVAGAPEKGDELKAIGAYSWIIDFEHPFKVKHPVTSEYFPSNDFVAFLESDLKDRSLLTGEYADDGWGVKIDGHDKPFWFVGVYVHWSVVRLLLPAMDNLSKAYLITGDAKYAHACNVLLWQLAEYYPDYNYETQSRYAKEVQSNYNGRLLYHTWEAWLTCHSVPTAYDAVRQAIDDDKALQTLTGMTGPQIREHIEERILRTMAGDITDGSGRIQGNYGMHQSSLLGIAAVLDGIDGSPDSNEMRQWVLNNPNAQNYTQIGLEDAMNNLLHRDGHPFESPSYNTYWVKDLNKMVTALGKHGDAIRNSPRFRKLFTWPLKMACAGEFTPSYGDSNHMFHGLIGFNGEAMGAAFHHFGDPVFAKAMQQAGTKPLRDLFTESIDDAVEESAAKYSQPIGVTSELLPGVGFVSLQSGSDANRTAAAIYYGYYWGHAHYDRLQLDLYSWGHALTPDFGYPESADAFDPRRFGFLSHTVSHNTVMVNASRQKDPARGRVHIFDPGDFAQVVEVSGEDCYPGVVDLYRRTLIMVEVSPTQSYLVDIFRVRGGKQHDWIVHGTQADFVSDLPFSAPREEGTLAGADVAYGEFYDDPRFADNNKAHVAYYTYEGSAYQWLFNVQQAKLNGEATATWKLNRPEEMFPERPRKGLALRAHLVGQNETVFACDGKPQLRKNWPETVKFLVRRREGDQLESVFVTVFEAYKDTPFIQSVKALPSDDDDLPVALQITLDNDQHQLFNSLSRTEITGTAGRYKLNLAHTAKVQSVDYDAGRITLDSPIIEDAGGHAFVESDGHGNAVPVAKRIDDRTFEVGDDDLCAGVIHVNWAGEHEGRHQINFLPKFVYFLEPGMTLVNETGDVVGRLVKSFTGAAAVDRALSLDDFSDLNGDGRHTVRVAVIGPGDQIKRYRALRDIPGTR